METKQIFTIEPAYNHIAARAVKPTDIRSAGGIIVPESHAMYPNEYIITAIGQMYNKDGKLDLPWKIGDRIIAHNGCQCSDPNTGEPLFLFQVNTILSFFRPAGSEKKFPPTESKPQLN